MHADFSPEVTDGEVHRLQPLRAVVPRAARSCSRTARRVIDYETCYGCGECVASCPHGAIGVQCQTDATKLQEKIVEHCAGALAGKEGKVVYLSFLTNMSPDCDCWNFSDAAVVADLGVLASTDPVAIDQAAVDLVNQAAGLAGLARRGAGAGRRTSSAR